MDYTSKYKLKKPSYDDIVDIEDINANSDTIDSALSEVEKTSNTALSMASNYILSWIFPKDEDESNEEYEDRKNEITQYNLEVLKEVYRSGSNNVFLTYNRQTLSLSAIRPNNPDTIDGDITYVFIDISEGKISSLEVNYMPFRNEYSQYERQISIGSNITPVSKTDEMTAEVGADENGKLWFDPLSAVPFSFESFTISPSGLREKGSEIRDFLLRFKMNKTPDSVVTVSTWQALDGKDCTPLDGNSGSLMLDVTGNAPPLIAESGSIHLKATYRGEEYLSQKISLSFVNRIFMGAASGGEITEEKLNGLSVNRLSASKVLTSTVTADVEEYVWYACPVSYGTPTFKVGGFEGGFELTDGNYSYTNPSGFTEAYQIWRSVNENLGTITVEVT